MIRLRKPSVDDRTIVKLVKERLFPLARESKPSMTFKQVELQKRLKRGHTYMIEQRTGRPMGFVHIWTKDGKLWVDMLAVDERMQGKGYGSKLLRKAEEYGMEHGCNEALLLVDSHNTHAHDFYRKHGYRTVRYVQDIKCYLCAKTLTEGAWTSPEDAFGGRLPPGMPGPALPVLPAPGWGTATTAPPLAGFPWGEEAQGFGGGDAAGLGEGAAAPGKPGWGTAPASPPAAGFGGAAGRLGRRADGRSAAALSRRSAAALSRRFDRRTPSAPQRAKPPQQRPKAPRLAASSAGRRPGGKSTGKG